MGMIEGVLDAMFFTTVAFGTYFVIVQLTEGIGGTIKDRVVR